jgi:EmrB/QacA subfamily drug resistance transporter
VLNAYLLAFAVLLITGGRLGDMFGQRNLFVAGLVVFTAASAACGLAPSADTLVVARVVQGVGAALMTPQTLTIIVATFPASRRGAGLGIFTGITALAAVSGPTLGGAIVSYVDWRWIFFANVPVGVAALILTFPTVEDVHTGRRHSVDVIGILLASAGLLALVYGLIEGQRYNWGVVSYSVTIPEIMLAGLALLAGFVLWERTRAEPLFPLALFRNTNFAVWTVVSMAPWFTLSGMLLVISINNQTVLGMSALQAGLTGLPMTLVLAGIAPFSGRFTDRFGGKYIVVAGLALYGIGVAVIGLVDSTRATSFTFTLPLLVAGLGMGAIITPMTTEALRGIAPELTGAASGLLNTTRQLSSVLGAAVIGAVLQNQLATKMHAGAVTAAAQLPPSVRAPFVDGFTAAVGAGLAVGRGQSGGARVPAGTPPELAVKLEALIHDVFVSAFVTSVRPALLVAAAVPLLCALACLLLVSAGRTGRQADSTTVPAPAEAPAPLPGR